MICRNVCVVQTRWRRRYERHPCLDATTTYNGYGSVAHGARDRDNIQLVLIYSIVRTYACCRRTQCHNLL
eukprot:SAG25_NODE_236_length_11287_cov_246.398999_15_plen_70_part_00